MTPKRRRVRGKWSRQNSQDLRRKPKPIEFWRRRPVMVATSRGRTLYYARSLCRAIARFVRRYGWWPKLDDLYVSLPVAGGDVLRTSLRHALRIEAVVRVKQGIMVTPYGLALAHLEEPVAWLPSSYAERKRLRATVAMWRIMEEAREHDPQWFAMVTAPNRHIALVPKAVLKRRYYLLDHRFVKNGAL